MSLRVLGCTGNDMCTATEQHVSFCPRKLTLADIAAGAADREHEPAAPDDLDRLRARRDAEVLRAAAEDGPYATEADRFWRAWLRERADHIAGDQS